VSDEAVYTVRLEQEGADQIGSRLEDALVKALSDASGPMVKEIQKVAESIGKLDFSKFAKAAKSTESNIGDMGTAVVDVDRKVKNLETSANAFAKVLGPNAKDLFEPIKDSLVDLKRLQDQFNQAVKDGVDPAVTAQMNARIKSLSVDIFGQIQAIQGIGKQIRAVERDASQERIQASRAEQSALRSAASERITQAQIANSQETALLRTASAERVATINAEARSRQATLQFISNVVRVAERGVREAWSATASVIGASLRGLERIASAAANGIRRSFSAAFTGLSSIATGAMNGLRRAVSRGGSDAASSLNSSLRQQERNVSESYSRQETTIRRFSENVSRTLGSVGIGGGGGIGAGGLALGAAGAGFLAASLRGGFQRFAVIEESQRALAILLQDAQKAEQLLSNVREVILGTPFGLDLFADATAQLVSFGVEAEKIPGILSAIGDASALKGARAPEFIGRLVEVFGQINTSGRVTLNDLNRIGDTGVNALQILGNQLGKTADEIRDMASAGKIGSDAVDLLVDGIKNGTEGINGATVALGGLAKGLGDTTRGALANFRSAMNRFGEAIIAPLSGAFRAVIAIGTQATDALTDLTKEAMRTLTDNPLFQGAIAGLQAIAGQIRPTVKLLRPVFVAIGDGIKVVGGLWLAFKAFEGIPTILRVTALAVKALVTPFTVAVAAIGAVSFVIRRIIEDFPEVSIAFRRIKEAVMGALAPLGALASGLLRTLGAAGENLREQLGSAFDGLINFLGGQLGPALFAVASFINDTVTPALQRFAQFAQEKVFPEIGPTIKAGLDIARSALTNFIRFLTGTVFPLLQRVFAPLVAGVIAVSGALREAFNQRSVRPILDALRSIGSTIASAIGGALERVRTLIADTWRNAFARLPEPVQNAFRAVGRVITVAAGTIATAVGRIIESVRTAFNERSFDTIIQSFRNLGTRIGDTLKNLFSADNLQGFGVSLLGAVRELGRRVGLILSDNRLWLAAGGVLAAGAAVAGSFVVGFVQGVVSNIPELTGGFINALRVAIREALRAVGSDPRVFGALVLLVAGASALARMVTAGRRAGEAVSRGFKKGVSPSQTAVGFGGGARQLLRGLFGGPAALQAAAREQAQFIDRALRAELASQARVVAQSQGQGTAFPFSDARGRIRAFADIKKDFKELERSIGRVGIAALRIRGGFSTLATAARSSFRQVRTAAAEVATGLKLADPGFLRVGFGRLREAISSLKGADVRNAFRDLARGLKSASGEAFAAAGAFAGAAFVTAMSSQLLFSSSSSAGDKAAGALGVATTFAATASVIGPKAAAAAAAVGLVVGAMQDSGRAAAEAKQRVKEYADEFSRVEDEAGAAEVRIRAVTDTLRGFSASSLEKIKAVGITIEDLADVSALSAEKAAALQGVLNSLSFEEAVSLVRTLGELGSGEQLGALVRDLQGVGEAAKSVDSGPIRAFTRAVQETVPKLQRSGNLTSALAGALGAVAAEAGAARIQRLRDHINNVNQALDQARRNADEARTALANFLNPPAEGSVANDILDVENTVRRISDLLNSEGFELTPQLSNIKLEQLQDDLRATLAGALQRAVDDDIVTDEATARKFLAPFLAVADELGPEFQAALIEFSDLLSQEDFEAKVAAVADTSALVEELESQKINLEIDLEIIVNGESVEQIIVGAREKVQGDADKNPVALPFVIDEPGLNEASARARDAAQNNMDRTPVRLPYENDAMFTARKAAVAALSDAQATLSGEPPKFSYENDFQSINDASIAARDRAQEEIDNDKPTVAFEGDSEATRASAQKQVKDAIAAGRAEARANAGSVGRELGGGIARGIGERVAAVRAAAAAIVVAAINSARSTAEASSPSRRMAREVGVPLAQGIAVGFRSSTATIRNAIFTGLSQAIQSVLADIRGLTQPIGQALAQGFAQSINQFTSGVSNLGAFAGAFQGANFPVGLPTGPITVAGGGSAIDNLRQEVERLLALTTNQQGGPFGLPSNDDVRDYVGEARAQLKALFDDILGRSSMRQSELTLLDTAKAEADIAKAQAAIQALKDEGESLADSLRATNPALADAFSLFFEQGAAGEAAFRAQARAAGLSATQIEDLIAKQRELRNAQIQLAGGEEALAEAQQANLQLLERAVDLLDSGEIGTNRFRAIAVAAGLSTQQIDMLVDAYNAVQRAEAEAAASAQALAGAQTGLQQVTAQLLSDQLDLINQGPEGVRRFLALAQASGLTREQAEELVRVYGELFEAEQLLAASELREANLQLLQSSFALINQGPSGVAIFTEIAAAAGLNAEQVSALIAAYGELQAANPSSEFANLFEAQSQLVGSYEDLLGASFNLIAQGPAGQELFSLLAEAAGLTEDEIRNLIAAYLDLEAAQAAAMAVEDAWASITDRLEQESLVNAVTDAETALEEARRLADEARLRYGENSREYAEALSRVEDAESTLEAASLALLRVQTDLIAQGPEGVAAFQALAIQAGLNVVEINRLVSAYQRLATAANDATTAMGTANTVAAGGEAPATPPAESATVSTGATAVNRSAVNIENAVFMTPTDADLVAQKVTATMVAQGV